LWKQLESLILTYNQITELPESICELRNLQILWLSGNNLTYLPRGFGRLSKLDWSWMALSMALDGNPLEHPPISVAKQGPEAIEKYLSLHQLKTQQGPEPTRDAGKGARNTKLQEGIQIQRRQPK